MGEGIVISLILLFMGITVLVAIHVCIVGRSFRRDHGHGGGGGTQQQEQTNMKRVPSVGGNIDDLKNLPCFDYEEKGCCSLVDCAVCLESFKAGDACRLLSNCSHIFHVQCIDSWILKTPFCPICRKWVNNRLTVPTTSSVSANLEIEMT